MLQFPNFRETAASDNVSHTYKFSVIMIIIINYTTFRKITFNYITKYQKISTHFHFPLGASYSQQKGAVLCEGNGKDGSLTTSRTKHENLSREIKLKQHVYQMLLYLMTSDIRKTIIITYCFRIYGCNT